jgi:ubiquinone biosynthesis protein COQ9
MTRSAPLTGLKTAESRLAKAVAGYVPQLGLNRMSLEAGALRLAHIEG